MTLNNVIQELQKIAQGHAQIKHFYFGEGADWQVVDKEYPACWLSLAGPARLTPVGTEYDFTLWLCDLVSKEVEDVNNKEAHANTIEVQSDMVQVLEDMVAHIDSPVNTEWQLLTQNVNAELYDFVPVNNDYVAGVKGDLTIRVIKGRDCSIIPQSGTDSTNSLLTEDNTPLLTETNENILLDA